MPIALAFGSSVEHFGVFFARVFYDVLYFCNGRFISFPEFDARKTDFIQIVFGVDFQTFFEVFFGFRKIGFKLCDVGITKVEIVTAKIGRASCRERV